MNETTFSRNDLFVLPNLEKRIDEAIHDAVHHFGKSCPYCGSDLYSGSIRNQIEYDHYVPVSVGGQHVPWNILPVCKKCNRKKKAKDPSEFLSPERNEVCKSYLQSVRNRMVGEVQQKIEKYERMKCFFDRYLESSSDRAKTMSEPLKAAYEILYDTRLSLPVDDEPSECINAVLEIALTPELTLGAAIEGIMLGKFQYSDVELVFRKSGLRIIDDRLYFGNSSSVLKSAMAKSRWSRGWARNLGQIACAKKYSCIRFHNNAMRATSLPLDYVFEAYGGNTLSALES